MSSGIRRSEFSTNSLRLSSPAEEEADLDGAIAVLGRSRAQRIAITVSYGLGALADEIVFEGKTEMAEFETRSDHSAELRGAAERHAAVLRIGGDRSAGEAIDAGTCAAECAEEPVGVIVVARSQIRTAGRHIGARRRAVAGHPASCRDRSLHPETDGDLIDDGIPWLEREGDTALGARALRNGPAGHYVYPEGFERLCVGNSEKTKESESRK